MIYAVDLLGAMQIFYCERDGVIERDGVESDRQG